MPIHVNTNGEWRQVYQPYVKINGVWRHANAWVKTNGVWRQTHKSKVEESDIIGFRLVYTYNPNKTYSPFPFLSSNLELPIKIHLTGSTAGNMDLDTKGILYEYSNTKYPTEGITCLEGRLYAVLYNDIILDICSGYNGVKYNDKEMGDIFIDSRLDELTITISGYELFEDYGYYISGWNSLFNKTEFLDSSNFPDKEREEKIKYLDNWIITPANSRNSNFDNIAQIGIARNMHTRENNMIGSHGLLDHTITHIKVNGIPKPFIIEYYI